jgi:acid phosphatase
MENHDYDSIIGSWQSPYINQLANDSNAALFTQSFALTHPSQPNYLILFSGSDQNVTTDVVPPSSLLPFSTPNLSAELSSKGKKFIGYSESLPAIGYSSDSAKPWVRKHCPWVNWQSNVPALNSIPPSENLPFATFPLIYDSLPDVCMIVPNLYDDMHDSSIAKGDVWLKNNLDPLVQWTKTHNGLFILTFDEDDGLGTNHIPTIFLGQNVLAGKYSENIDHYYVLSTIENMFGLPYMGNTSALLAITDCWKKTAIEDLDDEKYFTIYPNPSSGKFALSVNSSEKKLSVAEITIENVYGEKILSTKNSEINISDKENGIYLMRLKTTERIINKKIILVH